MRRLMKNKMVAENSAQRLFVSVKVLNESGEIKWNSNKEVYQDKQVSTLIGEKPISLDNKYRKGRAWIELNKENLRWNIERFQELLPKGCKLMPAVKANAYGHGSIQVARMLQECGVEDFCVASLSEGIELRRAGICGEILILGYTYPSMLEEVTQYDLTQTVVDSAYANELKDFGKRIKVHIGVDTGMHRLGESCERIENLIKMWKIPNLTITGIYSHLCVADDLSEDTQKYTRKQIADFCLVLKKLREAKLPRVKAHLLGSYGVLNYPEYCLDYVRVGIALYGILSNTEDEPKIKLALKPVLSLKTRVESIRILNKGEGAGYGLAYIADRQVRIAALAIGYADGVPRCLSNTGWVLMNGYKAPIIGRICMDQMLVDVTQVPSVQPGQEAVLIGRSKEEEIRAPLFASWTQTITNEILSRLGSRLERIIINDL